MKTTETTDVERALAWLEHHEEIADAADLIAKYVEQPTATADELQVATTELRKTNTDLRRQLALRMNRRGERAMDASGVSWI